MNKLVIEGSSETICDEDAEKFYNLISQVSGKQLDKSKNTLVLARPKKSSQNAKEHLVYCTIDNLHRVALKRCMDSPEFLRREVLISKAKSIVNLPNYTLVEVPGVILRIKVNDKTNASILKDWESKTFLAIDYGNINDFKPLSEIAKTSVHQETFFCQFGCWLAFNMLFGVQDRHRDNFVYSSNGTLHSVDNEFGPFDSSGRIFPVSKLVEQMRNVYLPYTSELQIPIQIGLMKKCFVTCWEKIASNISKFENLTSNETQLLQNSVVYDPNKIFSKYFS